MHNPVLATIGLSVCPSLRLSICLSHAGIEWKRRKLESQNFHRRIAQEAKDSSFRDKKFIQKFERVHPERGR